MRRPVSAKNAGSSSTVTIGLQPLRHRHANALWMRDRRADRERDDQPLPGTRRLRHRARGADDERQQAPGHDVVDRRAREGGGAELGAREAAVGQDPRQHGERGDRHRDAGETAQHDPREALGRETRRAQHGSWSVQPSRKGPAMLACEITTSEPPALLRKQPRVELQARRETCRGRRRSRDDPDRRPHRYREEMRLDAWRDEAEQRRAEQDAGQDFADDRRLADGREQASTQPARDDHHRQRQHERGRTGRSGSFIANPARRAFRGALRFAHADKVEPQEPPAREEQVDADEPLGENDLDVRRNPAGVMISAIPAPMRIHPMMRRLCCARAAVEPPCLRGVHNREERRTRAPLRIEDIRTARRVRSSPPPSAPWRGPRRATRKNRRCHAEDRNGERNICPITARAD